MDREKLSKGIELIWTQMQMQKTQELMQQYMQLTYFLMHLNITQL